MKSGGEGEGGGDGGEGEAEIMEPLTGVPMAMGGMIRGMGWREGGMGHIGADREVTMRLLIGGRDKRMNRGMEWVGGGMDHAQAGREGTLTSLIGGRDKHMGGP